MPLSRENLLSFWEKARQFRTLFGTEINDDFHKFCEMFISIEDSEPRAHGLFWRVDDFVGVVYLTHIQEFDAQVHYAFFDRRHHGRQLLVRRLLQYGFEKYGFRRLSCEIPYFARGTFQFVEEVGFKNEGRKRKAVPFDGEWFDVRCYGVLREEASKW